MTDVHRRMLVAVALVLAASGCASAPTNRTLPLGKVDTGPGTLTEARQYLKGRWTLVSMDLFPPGEPAIHAAAAGTLVYDEFSNMIVELKLNPATTRLAEQLGIAAPDGIVSTTGRTVIDIGNRSISYVLEGQAAVRPPKHPLDLNLPRYWEVNGDTLTLRTRDGKGDVLSVSVWQKAR
jgi:hypothetical protein